VNRLGVIQWRSQEFFERAAKDKKGCQLAFLLPNFNFAKGVPLGFF
jgi:hypothetical protein